MKLISIAWTRYSPRSDTIAARLGAEMHYVYYGQQGKIAQAPLRYLVQAGRSWKLLRHTRPDVVLVQDPPLFGAMVAAAYCQLTGAKYLLDSHTAAFLSPKWRWSLPLHRMLSRGALTTIVTNRQLQALVHSWGANCFILGFTPVKQVQDEPFPVDGGFNVAVISTGAEDEPRDAIFEAARQLPLVTFYITGVQKHLDPQLASSVPANCHLTGFLSDSLYMGLLRRADLVMDLTTRDQTLLLGAFEGVFVGTPLIVSDWQVLRDYFSKGTVHISNTVEGIRDGICRAQREIPRLKAEILQLRDHLNAEWYARSLDLERLLEAKI